MKNQLIIISALVVTIGLTACSLSNQSDPGKKETGSEASKDLKRPLVIFYTKLTKTINEKDAALNAYESSDNPTPEMKTQASESATEVANQLKQFEIPSELKEEKAQLDVALKDIANSYSAKAFELKKKVPSLDQANATFTKGVDQLGDVYVENKLLKPDLNKEVN